MTADRDAAIRAEAAGRIEFIEPAEADRRHFQEDLGTFPRQWTEVSHTGHTAGDLGYSGPDDTLPNNIDEIKEGKS